MTIVTVSLTPENQIATEGETFAWNFTLDQAAPVGGLDLFLPVTVNNDPAPGDIEYFVDGTSNIINGEFVVTDGVAIGLKFTINEGATEATLVSQAVEDDITEIDEFATFVLADGENYQANPEQDRVNLVLTELPVVSIAPEEVTAAEGETFEWTFTLNQPAPEEGLSLFLPITVNNDPAPGDVEYNIDGSTNISDFEFVEEDGVAVGFNLTIAAGETEATLVSEVVSDDLDEETEIFTTVIADGENYRANPAQNQVTTTLLETAPTDIVTVSLTPENQIATEGETFAWNFTLDQAAPVGGLDLFLPVTVNNDPAPGDIEYFVDGTSNISNGEFVVTDGVAVGLKFTINEGATEATLVSQAVEDEIPEIDEFATFVLADGENYQANPEQDRVNLVLTELPVVSIAPEEITVAEGETFEWNFSLNQEAPEAGSLFAVMGRNKDNPSSGAGWLRVKVQAKVSPSAAVTSSGAMLTTGNSVRTRLTRSCSGLA